MKMIDNISTKLNEMLVQAQADTIKDFQDEDEVTDLRKNAPEKTGMPYYRRMSLVDPTLLSSFKSGMGTGGYGPYKHKYSHVSNQILKQMSLRTSVVAAIIQTRVNQILDFCKPQPNRYETGYKIMPQDPSLEIKPGGAEEQEIKGITDFINNCGINTDRDEDEKMNFSTFLQLIARDRLTFAYVTVEKIPSLGGGLHHFIPAPAESMYYANKEVAVELLDKAAEQVGKTAYQMDKESQPDWINRIRAGEIEYVQVVDGQIKKGFTRNDMIFKLGNPQNFIDNNGYPIGELEMATNSVTMFLQAEAYNGLFFTSGFAARGLLHIQGDIAPSQLQAFRAQWKAQVAGNGNSWRTPVIAGGDEVKFIPLSATNRDMEYIELQNHIIRTLCSLFQISPMEIGFDLVAKGMDQKSLGESNNEWKVRESKSRGLKPLMTWIESLINDDILPCFNKELAAKYKFCFVGLGAESKQEELQRQQLEIGLHSSINDIRKEIDKDPIPCGDIPLNPAFLQTIAKYLKVGEIREIYLQEKGAAGNPEYNYIPDPSYFQNKQMELQQIAMEQGIETEGEEGEEGADKKDSGDKKDDKKAAKKKKVEKSISDYLLANPDIIRKALEDDLMKASSPKVITTRFDKMKEGYLSGFDAIQRAMIKEILQVVAEETPLKEDPDVESEKNK